MSNKTDQSLRNICIAAIKRHTSHRPLCHWTKYYEIQRLPDLGIFYFAFSSVEEELPIVSVIISTQNWMIITTRKVVGEYQGERQIIPIEQLRISNWGDFKETEANLFTQIELEAKDSQRCTFQKETGAASLIPICAIQTLRQIRNKK